MVEIVRLDLLLIFVVIVGVIALVSQMLRGKKVELRRLPVLEACEEALRASAEKGTPLIMIPAMLTSYGRLGHPAPAASTATLQAYMEVVKHLSKLAGPLGVPIYILMSRFDNYMMSIDSSEMGYREGGHPEMFDPDRIMWFSEHSAALQRGHDLVEQYRPAAIITIGNAPYGSVSTLFEPMARHGGMVIAGDQWPDDNAAAIAGADYISFGEDTQAMGTYLSKDNIRRGCLFAEDFTKIFFIACVVVIGLLTAAGMQVF